MPKKILVVDDEELITKSLLKLLSTEGYNPIVVRSGREAIEKVKETDFELIVCDVRMPEMDGIEIIKKIRAYFEKSNKKPIPEILITGYADKEKYETALDLKVADYIYKPFERTEFLKVVKKTMVKMPEEKRNHPRIKTNLRINIPKNISGNSIDLSEGGLSFNSTETISSPVTSLQINFPGTDFKLKTDAKLIWKRNLE